MFPGAEHSRFSHVLGAMQLAGRVYDALAAKGGGLLDPAPDAAGRRLVRAAALLHDLGHAPFSHSAEDLFEEEIDHEQMTRRLFTLPEIEAIFAAEGRGLNTADVARLLSGQAEEPAERLLSHVLEAAHEEAGGNEKEHRHRGLHNEQRNAPLPRRNLRLR